MSPENLIPSLKELKLKKNEKPFPLNQKLTIHTGFKNKCLSKLAEKLSTAGCKVEINETEQTGKIIISSGSGTKTADIPELSKAQEYFLSVNAESIVIAGNDGAGLFYGIQSLLQVIDEDENSIPCTEIRDWPDIPLRGIHLDLKGAMPDAEHIMQIIEKTASYKMNCILLEYEDKFPYRKHAPVSAASCLSEAELKNIVRTAEDNYVEIIPLLQCLGHVEYVLKHREYEELSEEPGKIIYQYCPSKPQSIELWKEMALEILEFHKNSRYFHIGADEAVFLGHCPECKERSKREGITGIFASHVRKACDFLKTKGKHPIMWDDMLFNNPDSETSFISEDVSVMYWNYWADNAESTWVRWQGMKQSKEWFRKKNAKNFTPACYLTGWFEDIPEKLRNKYEKYWKTENYPNHFRHLPYLQYYKDSHYKLMGAAAIKRSLEPASRYFHNAEDAFKNIRYWAATASREKLDVMISTIWALPSGATSAFWTLWYGITASAEFYWSAAQPATEENFDLRFARNFFGLQDSAICDCIYWLSRGECIALTNEALRQIKASVKRNLPEFEYILMASDLMLFDEEYYGAAKQYEKNYVNLKQNEISHVEKNNLTDLISGLSESASQLKKKVRETLLKTMSEYEAEKLAAEYFEFREENIRTWNRSLERT